MTPLLAQDAAVVTVPLSQQCPITSEEIMAELSDEIDQLLLLLVVMLGEVKNT